ncbi:MAG: iron complex outermembrane receptor protein [Colwellia sp.]
MFSKNKWGYIMTQRLASQLFKRSLLVSAVISALSTTVLNAQEIKSASQEDEKDIERIMVTASKRLTRNAYCHYSCQG